MTGATLKFFPEAVHRFQSCGGNFVAILPRLQNGWLIAPELKPLFDAPLETARRFYYDNIVLDQGLLQYLVKAFGTTRVLAGSDYPYPAGQRFPGRPFENLGLSPETLNLLLVENAQRFLGIGSC